MMTKLKVNVKATLSACYKSTQWNVESLEFLTNQDNVFNVPSGVGESKAPIYSAGAPESLLNLSLNARAASIGLDM